MNILKVLGVVVGIHVVAYLIIAQPGCRSNTARPETAAPVAPAPEAPSDRPVAAAEPTEGAGEFALNLPFAQPSGSAGERSAPTRPGTAAAAEVQPARTYTVVKGDSFALIARKNGISVAELAAANNSTSNATLRPGQKLVIPHKGSKAAGPAAAAAEPSAPASGGGTYTVKSGDTLSKIATRHHTTAAALRALNGLANDNLKIGQALQVPGSGTSGTRGAVAPAPAPAVRAPAPVPARASAPVAAAPAPASGPAGVHTVGQGESAESIARKYKITVGELARANQLTDPRKIRIGQLLNIPGAGASSAAKPALSLVPEIASKPAPRAPRAEPAPVAPVAPAPGADLDAGLPDAAADAPVIRVDEPPPAVLAPHVD
jgi:LysM repeat protein